MIKKERKETDVLLSYKIFLREHLGMEAAPEITFEEGPYLYGEKIGYMAVKKAYAEALKEFNEEKKRQAKS